MNYRKGNRRTYCAKCGKGLGYFWANSPLESKILIQFMEEKRWSCENCRNDK